MCVLQGDVEVRQQGRPQVRQKGEKFPVQPRRIQIHEAQPFEAGQPGQITKQAGQSAFSTPVPAIGRHILGDEHQLAAALIETSPGVFQDVRFRPAFERAANGWDGAEAAAVVTAFGDFQKYLFNNIIF